ncbi:polysaccharide pyruvyl transferase family protein [Pseudoalteromonas sp. SG43-6]|uniref:polysaccharide pyruvyl transferase family protein n=1 Tax=Pseudoalteromonas sp. SG43-6 TaxID=2760967 RepID=UPI0015FF7CEB|nr:polysaccharide pyruvyl transferase family protein [Pseudoalteromonas sp. SG43-6]MBB1436754.1 polysaccharide pyruvyl transferase family protein [Pseudoalteromonas sp. SG43-6]
MKVVLKGYYGKGNFGDDLLAKVLVEYLEQQHDAEVYCDVDLASYSEKLFPNAIYLSSDSNITYDLLLLGGGTQFFNFGTYAGVKVIKYWYKKYILNPKNILSRFSNKKNSFNYTKKIALGIGIGPFHSVESEESAIKNLSSYDLVSVRDVNSLKIIENSSLEKVHYCADICLTNKVNLFDSNSGMVNDSHKFDFGIVLRDWDESNVRGDFNQDIVREFSALVSTKKNKVLFFVYSKCDVKLIKLLEKQRVDFVVWDPVATELSDFVNLHKECKVIISSRYHGLITALKLHKPILPLIIEPKISAFSKELNISDLSFDLANVNIKELLDIANKQLEEMNFPEDEYASLCKRANEAFEQLNKVIAD